MASCLTSPLMQLMAMAMGFISSPVGEAPLLVGEGMACGRAIMGDEMGE